MVDNVRIERQSESTLLFAEGAKEAYLGYVTVKVRLSKNKIKWLSKNK